MGQSMAKINCIFCEEYREKAEEHIWPRWLCDFMGETGKGEFTGLHFHFPWPKPVSVRKQSIESLVYGNVCKRCNNGWMSELENQCSPLLKDVIENKRKANSWGSNEAELIAKWSFKTSVMINSGTNYRKIIEKKLIREFYKTQTLPEKVTIDFAFLRPSEKRLEWRQSQMFALLGPEHIIENVRRFKSTSFIICLIINDLIFRVLYWEDRNCVINPNNYQDSMRLYPFERQISFKTVPELDSIETMSSSIVIYE